ncbi:phenylalanine--tRNA ligase subunit alpha [Candidatus Woesearchaeota archaeon]|nr:phenylalanine--tRNA ligase subunit alpha [Candidatus Woesearchaeota archaeon]
MDIKRLAESLHPIEARAVAFLKNLKTLHELVAATGLSEVEVMRALQWLENKDVLKTHQEVKELVKLDTNGELYSSIGLPEHRLLKALKKTALSLDLAAKAADLSKEETGVSIGVLKSKVAVTLENNKLTITENGKKMLDKPALEEVFLKKLATSKAINILHLAPEEKFAFDSLRKRKNIIKTVLEKTRFVELTPTGKELIKIDMRALEHRVDRLTPQMLRDGSWKSRTFRRYDVRINVPRIHRGKRHFVNQATDYARRVWIEMGFEEMEGPLINTSFWNFDALFTAQDHPVRDMQDTFFIQNPQKGKMLDRKLAERVKAVHEHGGNVGSAGWKYSWDAEEAKRNVLRTHTTVLSAKTLAHLKKADWPAKFFAVGKCFRNETLDWNHLFEFNQTEGIVVDPDANFRHLLGYLKRFFSKLGFPQARFRPAYFPYTEPSIEIDVFHPVHQTWVELGGAGIFRPEVVEPLLGEPVPVLAWGPGFDRIMLEYYKISDIRDLYRNDIKQLREIKEWMR